MLNRLPLLSRRMIAQKRHLRPEYRHPGHRLTTILSLIHSPPAEAPGAALEVISAAGRPARLSNRHLAALDLIDQAFLCWAEIDQIDKAVGIIDHPSAAQARPLIAQALTGPFRSDLDANHRPSKAA